MPSAGAAYYFSVQQVSVSSLRAEVRTQTGGVSFASAGAAASVADPQKTAVAEPVSLGAAATADTVAAVEDNARKREEQQAQAPSQVQTMASAVSAEAQPSAERETLPGTEVAAADSAVATENSDSNAAAPAPGTGFGDDLLVVRGDTFVNVRSGPGTEYDVVGKMYDGSIASITEESGDWYRIRSGQVDGYIKAEFCMIGELAAVQLPECYQTKVTVNTTTLNVRTQTSTTSDVLGQLSMGDVYVVQEELDDWVRILFDGQNAYLFKDYVLLNTDYRTAESKAEEDARLEKERAAREARLAAQAAQASQTAPRAAAGSVQNYTAATEYATTYSEQGAAVAAFALQFVGNPYVHGGISLTNGADCCGFTMSVYAQFGVSIPRTCEAQELIGTPVDGIANAQPGDILCYPGHVALYIGNGQIVHASSPRVGIIIGNASYKTPRTIRRIFT